MFLLLITHLIVEAFSSVIQLSSQNTKIIDKASVLKELSIISKCSSNLKSFQNLV